ncbi:transporter [Bradyrhizobium manausense]|uniref:transporter n=1 Tax=Bradyrhizobium TaxID=374 RepID=UPI001BA8D763|nr:MULTISPECIES: transporter [Bradyrhizobium]MBR0827502.1 transporter [Bradyrhizobium manausense]UVO25991.1 transporter [Bradyrhizobium arachidis]
MIYRRLFTAALVASTAITATAASAHHPGVGGVGGAGGIFTIGAGTLDQGQFAVSAYVEYLRLKQLSDQTLLANIGNDVHGLQTVESRVLALSYGVTNDLTVSLRLPWVRRTGILEGVQEDPADPATVRDRGDTSGFGDVTVLGQYRFLNDSVRGTQAAVLFGFKAPTGRTNLVDPFGETFEAEFQPGSGSWDGLFGAAFSQRLTPALSFHANLLAIVTGTGTQDTNLGNRLLYNAALSYRLFGETATEPHSHGPPDAYAHAGHDHRLATKAQPVAAPHKHVALDAILEINGEWHDKQRIAGVADPNSGGNTIYVSPGLRVTVENWSGYVLVGLPVTNNYNGVQATPSWRVLGGVSAVFGP